MNEDYCELPELLCIEGEMLYHIGPNPPYAQNTPISLTATAIYYQNAIILQKVAGLLGKSVDAEDFGIQAQTIKQKYNVSFSNKETCNYAAGSQIANAVSLALGLDDNEYKHGILENIINDIRQKDNHTTSGDIGFRYLLQALMENDRSDVIMDMMMKTDNPSYGYQIEHGATILAESWDRPTNAAQSSQNHLMLGHVEEWFFRCVAGISYSFQKGDIANIVIRPNALNGIEWIRASHELLYGRLEVNWQRLSNGGLELKVLIPVNTVGTVYLPKVIMSLKANPILEDKNVRLIHQDEDFYVFRVGSGKYIFQTA